MIRAHHLQEEENIVYMQNFWGFERADLWCGKVLEGDEVHWLAYVKFKLNHMFSFLNKPVLRSR